jgi:MraZ protein
MFLGQYNHTIDEKGRITFPSRLRELLVDGAYITQGFDQNLVVMTSARWQLLYERINKMNMADPEFRSLRRFMFSMAAKVEFDNAGRFIIPQALKEVARLDGNAVVVGVGDDIEIWAPELWEEQTPKLDDPVANTQRFNTLDLSLS